MTTEQEIQLFKEIRELKDLVQLLAGRQQFMKVPEAAKFLNVGAAWLRIRCREGLAGTYPINPDAKNVQYNVDVIEAGKAIKQLGIVPQKRRNLRKTAKSCQ